MQFCLGVSGAGGVFLLRAGSGSWSVAADRVSGLAGVQVLITGTGEQKNFIRHACVQL